MEPASGLLEVQSRQSPPKRISRHPTDRSSHHRSRNAGLSAVAARPPCRARVSMLDAVPSLSSAWPFAQAVVSCDLGDGRLLHTPKSEDDPFSGSAGRAPRLLDRRARRFGPQALVPRTATDLAELDRLMTLAPSDAGWLDDGTTESGGHDERTSEHGGDLPTLCTPARTRQYPYRHRGSARSVNYGRSCSHIPIRARRADSRLRCDAGRRPGARVTGVEPERP